MNREFSATHVVYHRATSEVERVPACAHAQQRLSVTRLIDVVSVVSEIFLKIDEYLAQLQAGAWLSRAHCTPGQNTLLKDGESARNHHVLARNFAKYSPIF